jgi:hypothetical protein
MKLMAENSFRRIALAQGLLRERPAPLPDAERGEKGKEDARPNPAEGRAAAG